MTAPQAAPTISATSACPTGMKDLTEAQRATAAAPRVMIPTRASKGTTKDLQVVPVAASCLPMVRAQAITAAPAVTRCHSRVTVPASRMVTRGMVQAGASSRCLNGTRKPNHGGAWLISGGNLHVIMPVQWYPLPGMVLAWRCTPPGRTTREFSRLSRVTACPARNGSTTVARNLMLAA